MTTSDLLSQEMVSKLMASTIEEWNSNPMSEMTLERFIDDRMATARRTLQAMRTTFTDEHRLSLEHKIAMVEIQSRRSAIRLNCTHPISTYYPDPSGNNDSDVVCDLCDASIKYLKRKK